jgi:hypothetical protein
MLETRGGTSHHYLLGRIRAWRESSTHSQTSELDDDGWPPAMLTVLTPMEKESHERSRSSDRINRPNAEGVGRHYSQILHIDGTVIIVKDHGVDGRRRE